jgi:hypothetical protein
MPQLEHPLKSWIPYKLDLKNNDHILCRWLNTFNEPYKEPFFDETITKCKSINTHLTAYSSVGDLAILKHWAGDLNYVNPTAFIFHISRCGSTLVSQLLGMNERNVSLAEVPFFDDILRLPFKKEGIGGLDTRELLAAAIKFYGQKRNGTETNLFIKTDSWHIFYYKQIRELYPQVPFIFLYRRPDEVFNSHQKKRGMQAVPGLIEPELFGFDRIETVNMNQDVYTAKMLERYFEMYLEIKKYDKLSFFLDYKEGIIPIVKETASITKTIISDVELSAIEERSRYHSKYPNEVFSEKKVAIENLDLKRAFELHEKLERK